MSLSIGIVGLPNVGKSTLFKALTKKQVDIANYPFCTIDPNVGVVQVPDERLGKLAEFSRSKKVVPAAVEFVDIAGLVKGAAEGEGLGNKFLSHIREVDAICEVVRAFENEKITHVHNKIDPGNDIGVIEAELILADLETVNKRLQALEKEVRSLDKEAIKKQEIVKKIKAGLEAGKPAREAISPDEFDSVKDLHLLTFKPILYVYNISGISLGEQAPSIPVSEGKDSRSQIPLGFNGISLDIKTEEDLIDMSEEEKKELGVESNLDKLIVEAYKLLGLMTFFTTGEDETRAWTIKSGNTAPEAGAAIHTDFKEKFIRAEVINWQELLNAVRQSAGKAPWIYAREKGLIRTEGKEYVVKDGDVIEFKI
ncbi:MAG: redox-regulated ATPase YchF [Candidatus Terrybacteria bacterium]|nr:redox-regulated ATPase YchF [Candidatus Terrybacteria bacterium]